jgi:ADP-ribose pyrophosphatase YjhB (NUDIX family)
MSDPNWLMWGRELAAIAQTGLVYAADPFDRERYRRVQAIAARMLAEGAGAESGAVAAWLAAERGYATPKVGVRGAVFRDDGAILLVREVSDGRWALPGGWAEVNAAPAESVAREVREESGFAVVPRKLAAVFDRAGPPAPGGWPFHIYRLFFLCDIVGGAATPSDETSEVRFFGEHEIPDDLSANRSSHYHIARMFAHYRDPALPTEFD